MKSFIKKLHWQILLAMILGASLSYLLPPNKLIDLKDYKKLYSDYVTPKYKELYSDYVTEESKKNTELLEENEFKEYLMQIFKVNTELLNENELELKEYLIQIEEDFLKKNTIVKIEMKSYLHGNTQLSEEDYQEEEEKEVPAQA